MNFKRLLTAVIGLPIVILIFIFGNKYVIDCLMAIVAIAALNEYFKCMSKEAKPISWVGYVLALSIALMHFVKEEIAEIFMIMWIPVTLLILFLHIIVTNMKITLKDVAFSFLGIVYIISCTAFVPMIYGYEAKNASTYEIEYIGKYLIWILMITTWGSDIFAYIFGRHFGKHKFSKVSPNKTIEGCIAGIIGSVILTLVYIYCLNRFLGLGCGYEYYIEIGIISAVLCVIGQIGDFAASTIKRYFEVKDFGEVFPGHGGVLDRIDSVIFTAPFAYLLLILI